MMTGVQRAGAADSAEALEQAPLMGEGASDRAGRSLEGERNTRACMHTHIHTYTYTHTRTHTHVHRSAFRQWRRQRHRRSVHRSPLPPAPVGGPQPHALPADHRPAVSAVSVVFWSSLPDYLCTACAKTFMLFQQITGQPSVLKDRPPVHCLCQSVHAVPAGHGPALCVASVVSCSYVSTGTRQLRGCVQCYAKTYLAGHMPTLDAESVAFWLRLPDHLCIGEETAYASCFKTPCCSSKSQASPLL
eukprot:1157377-Pelagomonas_calceolata.AAC.1